VKRANAGLPGPHPAGRPTPWRVLFWAWAALVGVLTLSPLPAAPPVPGGDKLHHLLAFLLLGILARFGWRQVPYLALTFPAVLGYGALIELVQAWLPYRSGELSDLLADALGLLLVLPLVALGHGFRRPDRG